MVEAPAIETKKVAGVRFHKVGKLYRFDFSEFPDIQPADFVIVDTIRGRQMGQVMGFMEADEKEVYKAILRPATPRDQVLRQQWEQRQTEALQICQDTADELGFYKEVKFVAALYNYDGTMLTFLLNAEDRVDTRVLIRKLKRKFSAQLDTRQIGPRDVAKLLGGFGACGETRCCSTFLTDFSPISIKMAKAQGISLNPSEITGMCGRLRCCLVYEYEQYAEARKGLPKRNKKVGTPLGKAKVLDVYPLKDEVRVYMEGEGGVKVFLRHEIIPLAELEALAKKAKQPCDKHGDGACDCGMPPGQRNADKIEPPTDE